MLGLFPTGIFRVTWLDIQTSIVDIITLHRTHLAAGITEGDTVLTAITACFQPVDMVLNQNSYRYRLASFSESTSSVHIGNERQQTCRVDRSWAFQKGEAWVKFALVEFKRRGALEERDWSSSTPGSKVTGRGGKICRQLKICTSLSNSICGLLRGRKASNFQSGCRCSVQHWARRVNWSPQLLSVMLQTQIIKR